MWTNTGEQRFRPTRLWFGLLVVVLVAAGCSASATTITTPDATAAGAVEATTAPEPTALPEPTASSVPATAVPAEPTETPAATTDPEPGTSTDASSELVWSPCPGGECTTVTVPLDYDNPTGPTIDLAVARLTARDTEGRIGSLFVNFGGPGGESTSIFAAASPLLRSVFERFDIVTWDPRGVGQTARLECDSLGQEFPYIEIDASDGLDDEVAEQEAEFAQVAACALDSGPIIDHIGTANVARDMEQIRLALDEPMNYLGLSYGTQIGWVYATLFGESVRSMILDGAVPAGPISAVDFVTQLAGFQRTFDYFDQVCGRTDDCPFADEGFAVTVERVAEQLRVAPIDLGAGEFFTDIEFREALLFAMYQRPDVVGPFLTTSIANASNGDPNGLLNLLAAGGSDFTPGSYQAVLCADGGEFPGPDGQVADYQATVEASETFGVLGEVVRCDLWPGEIEGLPTLDSSPAPTILVVGNTFDPATPYESAVLLDQQLADSVLVTVDGGGHTAVLDQPCASEIAIAYVNELILPDDGTVCFTPGLFGVDVRDVEGGVRVNAVRADSAADRDGVLIGDVVVSIDGVAPAGATEIPLVRAGTPSEWVVRRDGQEVALVVTPDTRPWN